MYVVPLTNAFQSPSPTLQTGFCDGFVCHGTTTNTEPQPLHTESYGTILLYVVPVISVPGDRALLEEETGGEAQARGRAYSVKQNLDVEDATVTRPRVRATITMHYWSVF